MNLGTIYRLQPAPQVFITPMPGGKRLHFAGQRGRTYDILRSSAIDGPWEIISTRVAPADSRIEYTEPSSPTGSVFYKARRIP